MAENKKCILITIDVEEWYQVENLRRWIPVEIWDEQQSRVEYSTNRILDLLDSREQRIQATFFVLGKVAKNHPALVKELIKRGHEVASHGYNHLLCTELNEKALYDDLNYSKKLLEDIGGKKVAGYRAPSFSISQRTLRAVSDCGYQYDSSYNSFVLHGRYGKIPINRYRKIGAAYLIKNNFYEVPVSNLGLVGLVMPWGGGGYFRLMPFWVFNIGMRCIMKRSGAYIFYMHPWEIDAQQPKINGARGIATRRHYIGLQKTYYRLNKMLNKNESGSFISCSSYLANL